MPDETEIEDVLSAEDAQPHLRVHLYDDGNYYVWLNPDCTPHTGLCIGVGDTRADALIDAERTLERALNDVKKAARDAR